MTSYELKEFKELVRDLSKEALLGLKKRIEKDYRDDFHKIGLLENTEYLPTYKVLKADYIEWMVNKAKELDIINAELKRREYMK